MAISGGAIGGMVSAGLLGKAVLELSADNSKLNKGLSDAERATMRMDGAFTKLGLAGVAAFATITAASVGAAIDFESSFASVKKTVEGTDTELQGISDALRGMAKEIPVNVNGLNEIAAAAGQLGIDTQNVVGFTRVIADLGVATNLTGAEGAQMLARFANITQMDQTSFENLGSTIVELGNNFATTEQEIAHMGLRLAGAGEQIGLSEAEILGFAAALSSVGIEAEAGGTAFSRVMIEISKEVDTGGDKLELFAQTAGMSAAEFAKAFREDPAQAIIAFIQGLGNIEAAGGSLFETLEDLELNEIRVRDALLRTSNAGDLVAKAVGMANGAWTENNALTNEANARYETTASKLQIAQNRINDVGISIGTALLPAVAGGAEAVAGLVEGFGALPESTQNVLLLTGAMIALTPLVVGAFQRGAQFVQNFGTAMMGARTKAMLFAGTVGLVVAGVELLLTLTTGKGLFDRIFGGNEPTRSEKVADAFERIQRAMEGMSKEDQLEFLRDETLAKIEQFRTEIDLIDERFANMTGMEKMMVSTDGVTAALDKMTKAEIKELAVDAEALGQAMAGAGAPANEVASTFVMMRNIAPELGDAFAEGFGGLPQIMEDSARFSREAAEGQAAFGFAFQEAAGLVSTAGTQVKDDIVDIKVKGSDVVGYYANTWGPALQSVFSTLSDEGKAKLQDLGSEFPVLQGSAESVRSWLETTFGPDAADSFDQILEAATEAFEGVVGVIDSVLPDIEKGFDEWASGLQQMAEDHRNWESNLRTIYDGVKAAGIAVPDEFLTAVAEKGPRFAAEFAAWFAENPEGVMSTLAETLPPIMGTTAQGLVAEITGAGPGMDQAFYSTVVKPANEALAEAQAAFDEQAPGLITTFANGLKSQMDVEQPALEIRTVGVIDAMIAAGEGATVGAARMGKALAEGIISGMTAMTWEAEATMRSFVTGMIIEGQAAARTGSPSQETEEKIGVPMAEGIIVGLLAKRAELMATMEGMTEDAMIEGQRMLDQIDKDIATAKAKLAAAAAEGIVIDPSGGLVPGASPEAEAARLARIAEASGPKIGDWKDIGSGRRLYFAGMATNPGGEPYEQWVEDQSLVGMADVRRPPSERQLFGSGSMTYGQSMEQQRAAAPVTIQVEQTFNGPTNSEDMKRTMDEFWEDKLHEEFTTGAAVVGGRAV